MYVGGGGGPLPGKGIGTVEIDGKNQLQIVYSCVPPFRYLFYFGNVYFL
jgi:hypothetical protein